MQFPLSTGHRFGLNPFDIRFHTGDDSYDDEAALKYWQRQYQLRWDRTHPVTGRFDGPTQRAVTAVQHAYNLTVNAELDEETWDAGLRGPKSTESPEHDVPVPSPTPDSKKAPARLSGDSADSSPTTGPVRPERAADDNVPDWFDPHNPLGPKSTGQAVRTVRALLGLVSRDTWSDQMSSRIRGLQKINRLPVTGWVDTPTARILDKLRGPQ